MTLCICDEYLNIQTGSYVVSALLEVSRLTSVSLRKEKNSPLVKSANQKIIFLNSQPAICCGYLKETSQ